MTELFEEVRLERLELRTHADRRIVALSAFPRRVEPHSLAILVPGFGRDLRSLSAMSRLLNRHGYATLRYDATDHVGESDGDIFESRFTTWVSDTKAVMASVPPSFAGLKRFFVASSLAARPAVRAATEADLAGMVLIMPAVDLSATMRTVLGEDLFRPIREGRSLAPRTSVKILSYDVSVEGFYDTVAAGLDTLEGMRKDLTSLRFPVTAITGRHDEWIALDDVLAAMGPLSDRRRVFVLESGSHNLLNLPVLKLLKETTVRALEEMNGRAVDVVADLDFAETVETTKSEKRFMQQAAQ